MKPHIKPCDCEICEKARWEQPLHGCWTHVSFWAVVTTSPQWALWQAEQRKRMREHNKKNSKTYTGCFAIDECQELGIISQEHFQAFIEFICKKK